MYLCYLCNDRYDTIEGLEIHLLYGGHATSIYSAHRCRQMGCSFRFENLRNFVNHLRSKHKHIGVNDGNVEIEPRGNGDDVVDIPEHNPGGNNNDVVDIPEHNPGGNNNDVVDIPEHNPGDDHDANHVNLEGFVNSVYKSAEVFAAQLSSLPNWNRQNVTDVISMVSQFNSSFVHSLKEKVLALLMSCACNNIDLQEIHEVTDMFNILSDPFEAVNSEYKRLSSLEKEGFYIKPESFLLGSKDVYHRGNNCMNLDRADTYGQHVPLRKVLKSFLEVPGMFKLIIDYIDSLENDNVIRSFVQGQLWKQLKQGFHGKIVLPLFLHFDDYEPNNALGSHANDHSLAALYATLACLPPQLRSCIQNMFLVTVMLTADHKKCGNAVAFGPVIQELIFLEESGVQIDLDTGSQQVHFCFTTLVADNKGNNAIQGFVESFSANFFCRICKVYRRDAAVKFCLDPTLRRTVENYQDDITLNDVSQTGVKELCVWNNVHSYNVVTNISCDIFHDVFEGMLKYGLCAVLRNLICEQEYFSIETFHERVAGFDYGPSEICNKPTTTRLTIDKFQSDGLNLSASEYLCLGRYLGEMIGDLVPSNSRAWRLYLLMREIIEILTSPNFVTGSEIYLNVLIMEHHELYLIVSKSPLKPKHHLMLHYPEVLVNNGPALEFCTATSERKHRMGKLYLHACSSRVNTPLSVAIKLQLQFAHQLMQLDVSVVEKCTSPVKAVVVSDLPAYNILPFNETAFVNVTNSIEICGTLYKTGMVVVYGSGLFPLFATIVRIVIDDDGKSKFILQQKETLCYRSHICAYVVKNTDHYLYASHKDLLSFLPLWERVCVEDGKKVISMKCTL